MRGRSIGIGAVVLYLILVYWIGTRGFEPTFYPVVNLIMPLLIFIVLPGGVCLEIVAFARRRQTVKKDSSPESPREKIVTERVLVICPYCGAKTEQGLLKCQNCRADL